MSKIGDLIVRMQLKYQDYQKGLKQAEKETKGFASSLGKIKGIGVAVWGAVGASVTAMAKTFVQHSQTMSDKWNVGVNQMKAVWDQFLTSLTSWDWEGFGSRISDAMDMAKKSIAAHDSEFEVTNAIKLRKAAMADELAQLQILMRDTGKSYNERAKAAEQYLNKVKPLYDAEIELRKRIYMTDTDEYLKNAGLKATADNRDLLRTFFTDIAPDESLVAVLNEYQKKVQGKKRYKLSKEDYKVIDDFYNKYGIKEGAAISVLAQYYQSTNDKIATKVVDAIERYDSAIAQFNEETRKVQTVHNTALAQMEKEQVEVTEQAAERLERVALDLPKMGEIVGRAISMTPIPDIIPDDWLDRNRDKIDAAVAEALRLQEITDQMNMAIERSIEDSVVGATQALVDSLANIENADASSILSALLQPFASTMLQLGEMLIAEGIAIKAFKESLKSLDWKVALAAGTALVAMGAALSAGIKKLGSSAGASGSSSTSAGTSSSTSSMNNYESTLTVEVTGRISGKDIVISGKKTNDSNAR